MNEVSLNKNQTDKFLKSWGSLYRLIWGVVLTTHPQKPQTSQKQTPSTQ
jgi:hypothetical protein